MWGYVIGAAIIAAIIGLSRKTGEEEDLSYEGSIGTSTEEGKKAKAALPKGARFYYPVGSSPMAIDRQGNDLFWDGEKWKRP